MRKNSLVIGSPGYRKHAIVANINILAKISKKYSKIKLNVKITVYEMDSVHASSNDTQDLIDKLTKLGMLRRHLVGLSFHDKTCLSKIFVKWPFIWSKDLKIFD